MRPDITARAAALDALCRQFCVLRLDLFGSVLTDQYDPARSDLDFLVEFNAVPDGAYADTYFGLKEGLETLFGRPVDLVVDSAITNRDFRESVDRTKTLLYAA